MGPEGEGQPSRYEEESRVLEEVQRRHQMVLYRTGLAAKMVAVQQRQYDVGMSPWQPGGLGDTKFMLSTGGSLSIPCGEGPIDYGQRTWSLSILKSEGPARTDGVSCTVFRISQDIATKAQTIAVTDGFDLQDAAMVYQLAREFNDARKAGVLSLLRHDLHSLSVTPVDFEDSLIYFDVDERLFDGHLDGIDEFWP